MDTWNVTETEHSSLGKGEEYNFSCFYLQNWQIRNFNSVASNDNSDNSQLLSKTNSVEERSEND